MFFQYHVVVWNIFINSSINFNTFSPIHYITCFCFFKRLKQNCNDRSIISREIILISNSRTSISQAQVIQHHQPYLVYLKIQRCNAHLLGETTRYAHVFWHRTICGRNNKNCSVHLSCTVIIF